MEWLLAKLNTLLDLQAVLGPYDSKTEIIRFIRIIQKYACLRVDSELGFIVEPFNSFTNMSVFTSSGDCQYKF